MRTSKRIALPLTVALHLLVFYGCERLWKIQLLSHPSVSESLAVHFIFLPPPLDATRMAPASAGTVLIHSITLPRPAERMTMLIPLPASERTPDTPLAATSPGAEPRPLLMDPAALVKASPYQEEKSDLQKRIEAHGGTVKIAERGKYEKFEETAEAATVPDCLGKDGLKLDPPHLGPVGFGGLLALPFLAHAAVTGKCR
jgi:hypothetical protein